MDAFISKVTSRWQITIPQTLREEEGISEDDYVVMRKVGNYIVLGKVEARLNDITSAFEQEAKRVGLTKTKLLAELEKVRKTKR